MPQLKPLKPLKPQDRDAIVQSLRAGVTPKRGLEHIQVDRSHEIEALIKDIDRITQGGSAIRFIIGEHGSGKTFFMNLIQLIALEKGLVVMSADLAPDRRLHATGGYARALYAEMVRNLSTRSKPDGNALANVVERFISTAQSKVQESDLPPTDIIRERLAHFEELAGGFDFASVVRRYWEGHEAGDDGLKSSVLRWLRGEFTTRTDARKALGVRTIIDDANVYDHLKLMSAFICAAGYKGLVVSLDEMVNLYRLTTKAREANYEQILRIFNDVLQGCARNIGFLMGGTPEFLKDSRRGLYSYEALGSRLAENTFTRDGQIDVSGPVLRLANLTPEDLFQLLKNIHELMQDAATALPDRALEAFIAHCSERIGEAHFRTPRNTIKAFIQLLDTLEQNPGVVWSDLIKDIEITEDQGDDMSDVEEATGSAQPSDDNLARFRL